ncbi:hypothetical protein AAFF27_25665 [Xylophilus sp. GW821-FHT01B05]
MKWLCALLAALALCAGCAGGSGRSGDGSGVTVFGDIDAAVSRTKSK